jgi:glucose/arabinose dehydrogenase
MNKPLTTALLALVLLCACSASPAQNPPIERLKLPPGFALELWARVQEPRAMALGADRTLFVGSRGAGKVHAIKFDDALRAGAVSTVAEGLDMPVGVAFRDGALYVSSISRILRYDAIEAKLANPPRPARGQRPLPEGHPPRLEIHRLRAGRQALRAGRRALQHLRPRCRRLREHHAHEPDGSQLEVYARGVRNSGRLRLASADEGAVVHRQRARLDGRRRSPRANSTAPKPGMHFGYPFCHGGTIADPEFGSKRRCSEFVPPAANLGPHVAPLGMRFYTGTQFPAEYRDRIFIALHGSWNRAKKSGYQVVTARLDGDRVVAVEPFITGWLQGESNWGRPADVLMLPDGSLLVSDDQANAIYRVRHTPR